MSDDTTLDATGEAVRLIMALPQNEFDTLIRVLDTGEIPTSQARLERLAASGMSSKDDAETIAQFALAFAGTLYWGNYDPERTITRMAKVTGEQVAADPKDVELRIRALFRSRAVLLVAGAQAGRQRTAGFVDALSIQTDLRPVVHPEGGKVELFGIYHRLRIVVTDDEDGADEKVVEVVLDHARLRRLEKDVSAAIDAQQELQSSLAQIGASVYLPMSAPASKEESGQ
jgi:hypothetical protein